MAKRRLLPDEARSDFLTVCRFSAGQLQALAELFSSEESIPPFEQSFFEKVAERLHLDDGKARSALSLAVFLQNLGQSAKAAGLQPTDFTDEIRISIGELADPAERQALFAAFDHNRSIWESLVSPKPARVRALKIRQLSQATQRTVDEFRTICQLRPLFEDTADGHEAIAGHVLTVLMELTLISTKGTKETLVFDLRGCL